MYLKALVVLVIVLHVSAARKIQHKRAAAGGAAEVHKIAKRAGGVTAAQIKNIVDGHNEQRRKVGGANIDKMTWNSYLAQLAQQSSDTCVSGSPIASFDKAKLPGVDALGQNSFSSTGYTKIDTALILGLDMWYSKVDKYDPSTGTCAGGCGGASQVIWYNSKAIGCGVSSCPNSKLVVTCLYAPSGNYIGQKAFVRGEACTKCSNGKGWCENGLCNPTCTKPSPTCVCQAKCLNGGTVNPATCTCTCAAGWMGADCSEKCENKHKYCDASPGWPKGLCKIKDDPMGDSARKYCPLMCGFCQP